MPEFGKSGKTTIVKYIVVFAKNSDSPTYLGDLSPQNWLNSNYPTIYNNECLLSKQQASGKYKDCSFEIWKLLLSELIKWGEK